MLHRPRRRLRPRVCVLLRPGERPNMGDVLPALQQVLTTSAADMAARHHVARPRAATDGLHLRQRAEHGSADTASEREGRAAAAALAISACVGGPDCRAGELDVRRRATMIATALEGEQAFATELEGSSRISYRNQ